MKSVGQALGGSIKFRRDNRAMINEKTEGVLKFLTSGSLEGSGDGPLGWETYRVFPAAYQPLEPPPCRNVTFTVGTVYL